MSNGTGKVWDYTLDQLKEFDFGVKKGEHFKGLGIVTFEEILRKFACTTIMNIHVKIWDEETTKKENAPDPQYEKIAELIRRYGCEKHVYMMSTSDKCLDEFHLAAPDIHRCVGWDGNKDPMSMPTRAIKLGCEKIQLFKPYFTQETVNMARENGIICNVFWADDPDEALRYLDMGIKTILANDYLAVANAVKNRK